MSDEIEYEYIRGKGWVREQKPEDGIIRIDSRTQEGFEQLRDLYIRLFQTDILPDGESICISARCTICTRVMKKYLLDIKRVKVQGP